MKTLTANTIAEKNATSTAPLTLVKIEWGAPVGDKYYAGFGIDYSFDGQTWVDAVKDFGEIELALDSQGAGRISDNRIIYRNEPGYANRISDHFASLNPIGKKVTIFQHFDGNLPADLVTLFVGETFSPINRGKDDQDILLAARDWSQHYRQMIGNVVETTTYPNAPRENQGRTLPTIYGQAKNVPGVKVQEDRRAELEDSILSIDTTIKLKRRWPGDDFSDWPTGAHVIKIDSEEISASSFSPTTRIITVSVRGRTAFSGTTDGGTTSGGIVDATLTEAEGFWRGYIIEMTSGSNNNEERECVEFDSAADECVLGSDLPNAQGAGDTFNIITKAETHNSGAAVQVLNNAHVFILADHPSKDVTNVRIGDWIPPADTYVVNKNDTTYSASGQTTISFHTQPIGVKRFMGRGYLRVDADDTSISGLNNIKIWAFDSSMTTWAFINENGATLELGRADNPFTKTRQKLGELKRAFLVVRHQARRLISTDTYAVSFKEQGGSYTNLGNLDTTLPLFDSVIDQQDQDQLTVNVDLSNIEQKFKTRYRWKRLYMNSYNISGTFVDGRWTFSGGTNDGFNINDGEDTTTVNRVGDGVFSQAEDFDIFYDVPSNLGMLRRGRIIIIWGVGGGAPDSVVTSVVGVRSKGTTIVSKSLGVKTAKTTEYSSIFFFDFTDNWDDFNDPAVNNKIHIRLKANAATSGVQSIREIGLEVEYVERNPTPIYNEKKSSDLDLISLLNDRFAEIQTTVFDITDKLDNDWNMLYKSNWKIFQTGTTDNENLLIFDFFVVGEFERYALEASDEIFADVDGVDSNGDTTGTLLESPADIIEDILLNRMGVASGDVDSAGSFAATATSLSTEIVGGYKFAFALNEQRMSNDILAELATQCRCYLVMEAGVYKLYFRDDAFGIADGTLSDAQILPGAMHFTYSTDDLSSEVLGFYAPDYTLGGNNRDKSQSILKTDAPAQAAYGQQRREFDFWGIREEDTADDVLTFLLSQLKDPVQTIRVTTVLTHLEVERGDIIAITDTDEDLSSTKFEVISVQYNLGSLKDRRPDTITFTLWRPNP